MLRYVQRPNFRAQSCCLARCYIFDPAVAAMLAAMPQNEEAVELKEELELARAEEAEALRRACNLRSRGASYEDMQAAMREASACHSRTARLHMELRRLSP